MAEFRHRFVVRAPLDRVRAFHEAPGALRRLTPAPLRVLEDPPVAEGARVRFVLYTPLRTPWRGHYENVTAHGFDDVMDEGPFRAWRHEHRYHETAPGRAEVHDHVIAKLDKPASRVMWASLRPGFAYRAWATRRACER